MIGVEDKSVLEDLNVGLHFFSNITPEDVTLLGVCVALEDLWRHPGGAAFHVGHHCGLVTGSPEITYLLYQIRDQVK